MKKRRMKYTTLFFLNFLFSLFIERERERERDKGGETVLLVSCQCEGIGNGSAEVEDMSEKKSSEGGFSQCGSEGGCPE